MAGSSPIIWSTVSSDNPSRRREMTPLLALSALLLCSSSASSASEVRGRNSSHGDPSAKTKDITANRGGDFLSEVGGLGPDEGVSPVCAYRVIEGGISSQLCFRHTLFGYKCLTEDCRTQVSLGTLVANVLTNGSVLLQWTHEGDSRETSRDEKPPGAGPGPSSTRSSSVSRDRSHRRGGYELSCWWNGSYTQFECASVHLGSGCRDFLLSELHENIPYRFCLRPLTRSEPDQRAADCVEFTLPTSGMQDIVIAMTTVGGAICVMLVIICLLVAYITENIMSPTTKHTYYRTHPRHWLINTTWTLLTCLNTAAGRRLRPLIMARSVVLIWALNWSEPVYFQNDIVLSKNKKWVHNTE